MEGIDDLIKLQFLDEPNILYNLLFRYQKEQIYVRAAHAPLCTFGFRP
jgi:myosin heavy subunit